MKTNKQKLVDDILNQSNGSEDEVIDKSLSARAYERAVSKEPPTTLTPWEWEQWYQEHGMPEKFQENSSVDSDVKQAKKELSNMVWWKRLFFKNKA